MELQAAHQIIDTLAQGIHPVTGEAMPEDSPYNAPPVIRALFAVSQALRWTVRGSDTVDRRLRGKVQPLPRLPDVVRRRISKSTLRPITFTVE